MNERILPEKCRFLSGSALKALAVAFMLIDHVALLLKEPIPLFTVFGKQISVYWLMRLIGRMAFPIFAFLLVEGYHHTRSRIRYGIVLAAFALLSEIPFDLFRSGKWFNLDHQNVFFTLLLGYLGVCTYEGLKNRPVLRTGAIVVLLFVSYLTRVDFGIAGFALIILMYALRDRELLRDAVGTAVLASRWKAGLAFIPLAFYNGKRGFVKSTVLKYAFYTFYPLHLLALYWIRMRIG